MIYIILLIAMLYCHVLDDFCLQGILASLKQKSWWEENYPNKLYKYDYIISLFIHAFSWTCSIHIPLFIYGAIFGICGCNWLISATLFISSLLIHAYVDNLKANKKKINLCIDQLVHIVQITALLGAYIGIGGIK